MINGKLQEFVCNVVGKGQISYGDVRRLQRNHLPGGITNREELELLISLTARLVRADRAWAQWLVAAIAAFVAKREPGEHPITEAADEWVGRLLAESTTSLGRKIARKVRRELRRQHGIRSTSSAQPRLEGIPSYDTQQPTQAGTLANDLGDCSLRNAKPRRCDPHKSPARSRLSRRTGRHATIAGAMTFAGAAHGWCLAGYLPAVQRSHLINFQSSRVALVLAPCR
jgi:hypothetical protein